MWRGWSIITFELMVSLPNYTVMKVIGSGCFGYVFEAYDNTNKRKVALKRVEKVGTQLSRQYEVLFQIKDCDSIVKILDFFYSKSAANKLIQNIVFEFMDDNLQSVLEIHTKDKEYIFDDQVKDYTYQILNGLSYIHSKNIAHRDLKPENILLSEGGLVKICDFGSSKVIDSRGKNTPYIVSRYYRAPELIMCITKYGTPIDIWAAGCILAELFLLSPIFKGKSEGDQLFAAFRVLGSLSAEEEAEFGKRVPFCQSILKQFGTFQQVNLRDKFFMVQDYDNFIDLLLKMLTYLPEKRITAKEAMNHPFFDSVRQKWKNLA